jgi:hypothetical protein
MATARFLRGPDMKRNLLIGVAALLLTCGLAWAVTETTKTTVVTPPEVGENSLSQGEIFNVARLKTGFGTKSTAVSGAAAADTINSASGIWTLTAATAGASGATPTVATLTNSKVGANDMVLCSVDNNGATAAAVLVCAPHVTANTVVFTIYSPGTTALLSSTIKIGFLVVTSGNPN